MCAQSKPILNYEVLSTRYINDTAFNMTKGDIVVLSKFNNAYTYVKFPSSQGASLVCGVVLDDAQPNQPVHLAQLGTAKVKVDNSNGNITAGDKITAKGNNTGLGIKWTSNIPKSLVAFALEDYNEPEPGYIYCKILFNVSEAIIPSTATGEFITGMTFTIGQGHNNNENDFFRILFGEQVSGDSHISWDGANQRFVFGGDVVFEGSTFMTFDEILELNADISSGTPPIANCGLKINRGSETDAYFIWNETSDQFEIGLEGNLSKIITEADLESGGLNWPTALEGDLLRGKTGGGGIELYSLSSGDLGDVLINTGTTSEWGQISFTKEENFTVGKDNTDGKINFINSLNYIGKETGENNVIFFSTTEGGLLLPLKSKAGFESKIIFTETNSTNYTSNLIETLINTSSLIPNAYGLRIKSSNSLGNLTNLYSLYIDKPTGATNNFAAYFGGHVEFDETIYAELNTSNTFKIGSGSNSSTSISFGDKGDFSIGFNADNNSFGIIESKYQSGPSTVDIWNRRFKSISGFETDITFHITANNNWDVEETIANKFKLSIENTASTPPEYPDSEISNLYLDDIGLSTFNIKSAYNLYVGDVVGATTNNYSAYFKGKTSFQNKIEILGDSVDKALTIGEDFVFYNASGSGQITTTSANKNITIEPNGSGKVILSKVAKLATYNDANEPASGLPADLWYNSTSKQFKTFDVDGTTKRSIAFIDSIAGSNFVYTNTIQTITSQKTFNIAVASSVANSSGTLFQSTINSGVSLSNSLKTVEILTVNNSGASGNNINKYYGLYINAPDSTADWGGRTATEAYSLFVEGPTVTSNVDNNWAGKFTGRVSFNNTATTNTSTNSFNSFVFETTQSANITVSNLISATVRIGAPAIGGTANSTHTIASLYLNAPLVTDAKNRSIYAEGAIESDNFIASLPKNLTNLASGHIRAGGTSIATINNGVNYHTLYANSYNNASIPDSGSICLSPYYDVSASVTEALVNIRPFYGVGNNPNLGLNIWTVGSGMSYLGLAKPGSSSSNINAFSTANATMLYSISSGAIFEVNGSSNQSLIFRNVSLTNTLNTAFEGGVSIGSTSVVDEKYLVLSSYSSTPSISTNGAIYYNSSTSTIKAQVSNGITTVNKDLEFKLYWEKEQFEFYETGYTGSTTGKINIDTQTYIDLSYQPADAESVMFLIRHAGSQLKDIDYTVNITGSNKRISFQTSLIDEIKLATNATDTVLIQIVYVRRDSGS